MPRRVLDCGVGTHSDVTAETFSGCLCLLKDGCGCPDSWNIDNRNLEYTVQKKKMWESLHWAKCLEAKRGEAPLLTPVGFWLYHSIG